MRCQGILISTRLAIPTGELGENVLVNIRAMCLYASVNEHENEFRNCIPPPHKLRLLYLVFIALRKKRKKENDCMKSETGLLTHMFRTITQIFVLGKNFSFDIRADSDRNNGQYLSMD